MIRSLFKTNKFFSKACYSFACLLAASSLQAATTITADADAYIRAGSYGDSNYGSSTKLEVKNNGDSNSYTREAWINFDTSDLSGVVTDAKLRVYLDQVNGSTTHSVYEGGTSWSESSITWNNQPSSYSSVLDSHSFGGSDDDIWVEYDVSSAVNLGGDTSFVIAANNSVYTKYASSEHSNQPQLILTITEASTGNELSPSHDAYVRGGKYSTNNYGSETKLEVKNSSANYTREAWLQFNVGDLSGTVTSAKLKIYLYQVNGSTTHTVYKGSDSWTESSITYDNQPSVSSALDSKSFSGSDDKIWVEYDVTSFIASEVSHGYSKATLKITANNSVYSKYASSEHSKAPVLEVEINGSTSSSSSSVSSSSSSSSSSVNNSADIPNDYFGSLQAWKLNLPYTEDDVFDPEESQADVWWDNSSDSYKGKSLKTFVDDDYFYVHPDGGVVFRAPCNGATTKGSGYPRMELREMIADGSDEYDWYSKDGKTHTMEFEAAVTEVPYKKPHVVVGQIHTTDDTLDDICVFRLEGERKETNGGNIKFYWTNHSGKNTPAIFENYELGTKFKAKLSVKNGVITGEVTYKGTTYTLDDHPDDGESWYGYFKLGMYTQSASSGPKAEDDAEYTTSAGECIVYSYTITHE